MAYHAVYENILSALKSGSLKEPFSIADFRAACPNFREGTYRAFLHKHRRGNMNTTELFELVARGQFKVIRPFKYQ
jgi:hypothetical protein